MSTTSIPAIDYTLLGNAQHYYTQRGYHELAVPWLIREEAYTATCPPERRHFFCLDGYLNASGEQSFLELLLQGQPLEKQFCITPCFRDEPTIDELHQRSFIKLELIDTNVTDERLHTMMHDAKQFFDSLLLIEQATTIVKTDESDSSYDIIDRMHGIELGSYGIRRYKTYEWIYGTGLALPRFQVVSERSNSYPKEESSTPKRTAPRDSSPK